MAEIFVVSLLSERTRPIHRAIVALLARRTGLRLQFVDGPPWQAQLAMLDRGEAQAAFMCGLIYTRREDFLDAVAAPIQLGERYGLRPVYFSDLIVRAASPFRQLDDVRGARFGFNEPDSLSGYAMLQEHLRQRGELGGFFGAEVASGSHLASLQLLLTGEVDTVAIDSTVLDLVIQADPALHAQLRRIDVLGPYPAPPFVLARTLPDQIRSLLQAAIVSLTEDSNGEGTAILAPGLIAGFGLVAQHSYDPIRQLDRAVRGIRLV